MHILPDDIVRAEPLFASHLQASAPVSHEVVDDTVTTLLRRDGSWGTADTRAATSTSATPSTTRT